MKLFDCVTNGILSLHIDANYQIHDIVMEVTSDLAARGGILYADS